jgi:hypothetical protein
LSAPSEIGSKCMCSFHHSAPGRQQHQVPSPVRV